jgi:hypothetical protein
MRWLALVALGACTYPEKEFSPPFGCIDDPPPTTTKQSVVIGGNVIDAAELTPIGGVSLTLLNNALAEIDGPTQSAADGRFQLTLPLGGAPFEREYVKAEVAGYVTSLAANPRPITDDFSFPYGLVSLANANRVAQATTGGMQLPPGTGTVFVTVRDCNDQPVSGATITTDSGKRVFYFAGVDPSNVPTATTARGVAMITDLTATTITLDVQVGGETYRPQTYRVEPDAFTQFDITP